MRLPLKTSFAHFRRPFGRSFGLRPGINYPTQCTTGADAVWWDVQFCDDRYATATLTLYSSSLPEWGRARTEDTSRQLSEMFQFVDRVICWRARSRACTTGGRMRVRVRSCAVSFWVGGLYGWLTCKRIPRSSVRLCCEIVLRTCRYLLGDYDKFASWTIECQYALPFAARKQNTEIPWRVTHWEESRGVTLPVQVVRTVHCISSISC